MPCLNRESYYLAKENGCLKRHVKSSTTNKKKFKFLKTADCPVKSSFGTLTNDSSVKTVTRGFHTFIWNTFETKSQKQQAVCNYTLQYTSSAQVSFPDSHSVGKVVDNLRQ